MRFADPMWLLVGVVVVTVVTVLLIYAERQRTRAIAVLAGARLLPAEARLPSRLRRWSRVALMGVSVALGFIAVARPQKGMHWETVERTGADVLLVLDTSRSMDADDLKPSRLERSKLAIRDLVQEIPGDRVGLVAFAGDAVVESPMTLDHAALLETVASLDTGVVMRGGTDIGHAIEAATAAMATEPDRSKSIVLISDGEDLEGQGLDAAKQAAKAGITIDTVGVGSAEGELVPAKDARGKTRGIVHDASGKAVRSKLDEGALRKIAEAAHGTYRPLGTDGGGLERLYAESLAPRTHTEASSRAHRVYSEWFALPLGLALAGIVLDSLLGLPLRRPSSSSKRRRPSRVLRGVTTAGAAAAAMLCLLLPATAHASAADAQKAYAAGRYEDAQKEYEAALAKHPNDATLAFDLADAAYKAGHYDVANATLERALVTAEPTLQKDALYNNGNALFRLGQGFGPDARAETKRAWTAAIAAYDGAIALDSKDADARFNRDLVKKKLAELEEKEEEQKKNAAKKESDETKDQKRDATSQGQQQQQPSTGGQQASAARQPNGEKNEGNQHDDHQQSANRQNANPQNGNPQNGNPQNGNSQNAPQPQGAAPSAGRLDERGARELLDALKGEERHAVRTGNDAGAADDPPRKDW